MVCGNEIWVGRVLWNLMTWATPRKRFCNDSQETRQQLHRLRLGQVPLRSFFLRTTDWTFRRLTSISIGFSTHPQSSPASAIGCPAKAATPFLACWVLGGIHGTCTSPKKGFGSLCNNRPESDRICYVSSSTSHFKTAQHEANWGFAKTNTWPELVNESSPPGLHSWYV